MPKRAEPPQTLTLETGGGSPAAPASPAEDDIGVARTLPAVAAPPVAALPVAALPAAVPPAAAASSAAVPPATTAPSAAARLAGMESTLDARGAGCAAPAGQAGVATLSLEGAAAAHGGLAVAVSGDEPAPIPSRLSSLPAALAERFESLELVGEGGMGAVYRARDLRLHRDVALKFLFGGGAGTSEKLLREARSQARLTHENACKVYEAGVAEGHRYIVMEYIDGEPLDRAAERMTLEEKVRAVRQIASALHEAHRLGLVHRDIKPSNILVEVGEDGAFKPYLMDFGLAREVGGDGPSVTKGIAGTPAFMAPEQATGDVRSLDRRTDVYSLGATLYDVVAGRPPFVDDNLFRLLQRVAREDPAPLERARPGVPADVGAIVMKCLEKEPGRRYESARALGEDLQRFLDGEPVQARRSSVGYVVLKKIRRHKAKVGLAAAALAATLVLLVAWVQDRRAAAERARIAQEVGEDVKEMELFLRNAYGLPLHDVERERDVVRARLRAIEARMAALGPAGEGPGHYAIGRGLLALRDPEGAMEHLRRAEAAGHSPPELDYAAGLALGELYRRALESAKRVDNPEQRRARIAAIEAEYKEPALRRLRAALGARLEVPAYVEGLIALYEGKNEEALAKAAEAYEKAPWLPDAKKLEGDAHFAEGSRFRPDAAYDHDRMMRHYERAGAAYRAAAEMASSDPEVHIAECELWIQVMNASQASPDTLSGSFERARRACERGVESSSRSGAARVETAFAYQVFAWQALALAPGGEEPEAIIEEAVARAEEAADVSPEDPMASYLVGAALRTQILHAFNRGIESGAEIERAVAAYEQAIALDPTFLWAHNELCWSYVMRAHDEGERGVDPEASFGRAVELCERAIRLDPSFAFTYSNLALSHYYRAQHLADAGRSPGPAVAAALAAVAAAREKSPGSPDPAMLAGWVHLVAASHASDAGEDPGPYLALAEGSAREVERLAGSTAAAVDLRGMLALVQAQHAAREGRDPEPMLAAARAAIQQRIDEAPWDVDYRIFRAQAEIIAARRALGEGAPVDARLDAAMEALIPVLDRERSRPQLYQTVAEVHRLRASARAARGERAAAEEEIAAGLSMAAEALARNPHMAAAHAVKGALLAIEAGTAGDPAAARAAARRAKESFASALRDDPLIRRDFGPIIDEVERR